MFLGLRLGAHFPTARIPYTDELPLEGESDADDSETDDALLPPAARQARAHRCCRSLSGDGLCLFQQAGQGERWVLLRVWACAGGLGAGAGL